MDSVVERCMVGVRCWCLGVEGGGGGSGSGVTVMG